MDAIPYLKFTKCPEGKKENKGSPFSFFSFPTWMHKLVISCFGPFVILKKCG